MVGPIIINYIPVHHYYDVSDEWLFACSGDATQSEVFPISHLENTRAEPAALGLGRPGALPAGLVQPCPKPGASIHKYVVYQRVLNLLCYRRVLFSTFRHPFFLNVQYIWQLRCLRPPPTINWAVLHAIKWLSYCYLQACPLHEHRL